MTKETIISRQTSESEHIGRVYTTAKGYKFEVLSVEQQQVLIEQEDGSNKELTRKIATVKFLNSGYITTVHTKNLPSLSSDGTKSVSLTSPHDKGEDKTYIGTLANKTMPSTDTNLYKQWNDLMRYAKNNNLPVDEELKCYAKFLQQATHIYNYEEWMLDETYKLLVRKGANKVALNTILFVSEEEYQSEYRKKGGQETKPVMAYIELPNGKRLVAKYKSQVECEKSLGISQPEVSMAKTREHTVGGGTASGKGWRIVELEKDDEFLKE